MWPGLVRLKARPVQTVLMCSSHAITHCLHVFDTQLRSRLDSGCCALRLLPTAPRSVASDVVATLSHRAWTTNRAFPLTDSNCWLNATEGEEDRDGRWKD
ncbi:hypothetical protein Q8A73_003051 [Channa argus]|nr:hypothetical protein Q8A73_003051 [Channa argus]